MASKVVLMTALFEQMTSFVTELSEMYPDDPDFSLFLTTLRMLKMSNPSMLSKYIYENVNEFESQIMEKNEDFFLTHEFEQYKEDINMDIFSKLKQYVKTMTPESKENVWKYCQNVYRLAKASHALASA
jgi:hypothetical protein